MELAVRADGRGGGEQIAILRRYLGPEPRLGFRSSSSPATPIRGATAFRRLPNSAPPGPQRADPDIVRTSCAADELGTGSRGHSGGAVLAGKMVVTSGGLATIQAGFPASAQLDSLDVPGELDRIFFGQFETPAYFPRRFRTAADFMAVVDGPAAAWPAERDTAEK